MTNYSSDNDLDEFGLIAKYFAPLAASAPGAYGLTDDAATIALPPGEELVVTTDLLSAGTHFFSNEPSDLIAKKALRVNLSDLAAKSARPFGYLLSLAMPRNVGPARVELFAHGLAEDQKAFGITLLGGDTTATDGPLTISITAFGSIPTGTMTKRSGAYPGDLVFVTGTVGDAGAGLAIVSKKPDEQYAEDEELLARRYRLPEPRVAFGTRLRGIANAALDVSDGLIVDLEHIASTSKVRISIVSSRIPLSAPFRAVKGSDQSAILAAATAGDDYEIAFTAPVGRRDVISRIAAETKTPVTEIGHVEAGEGIALIDDAGAEISVPRKGYKHF